MVLFCICICCSTAVVVLYNAITEHCVLKDVYNHVYTLTVLIDECYAIVTIVLLSW